jgi:hypothetical protein
MYKCVFDKIRLAKSTGTITKVSLIQQRICLARKPFAICAPNIYHVGLFAEQGGQYQIFEHGPVQYDNMRSFDEKDTVLLGLPKIDKTIDQLQKYSDGLDDTYFLGIRDCRHYVEDMLDFMYDLS